MSRLLHLNGPPGIGKSTLARRWAEEHPGTLLLDVDALRTWVGGWRDDFAATGAVVRPVALAMITSYVGLGRDVVLPQLIARPEELARFAAAAVAGGGELVEVLLTAPPDEVTARFGARAQDEPWLEEVHRLVAADDGGLLRGYDAALERLGRVHAGAILVDARGDAAATYADLRRRVDQRPWPGPADGKGP